MAVASPRLERYAVAALPVCALSSAASADIIYTQVNQTLTSGQSWSASVNGNNLNVRADGYSGTTFGYALAFFSGFVTVENGGIAATGPSSNFYANRFVGGQEIGAGANFDAANFGLLVSAYASSKFSTSYSYGDWAGEEVQGFVGFRVENGDDFNYGWLDITFKAGSTPTASELIVGGYAYETDVNTAIVAGATESSGPVVPGAPTAVGLMGLAAGAAGIRRKRSA